MKKLLLLPSAKLIPPELQIDFGAIPSAMVPLGGRPALHYILNSYRGKGFKSLIIAGQNADLISKYLEQNDDMRAQVFVVGDTKTLGETILTALQWLPEYPDQLMINFGDTYLEEQGVVGDTIYYCEIPEAYRWTTFELDEAKQIVRIIEKEEEKASSVPMKVFVGIFSIGDPERFRVALERAVAFHSTSPKGIDPFYLAIQSYFNETNTETKSFESTKDWRDFGHLDTYHSTKKNFWTNRRFFNEVSFDSLRGIVRKSSTHVDKFIDEIKWYLKLPKGLQYVAPRLFDYSLESNPFVEMEFYGYPSLSDIYLFGNFDRGIWAKIFSSLSSTLREFAQYRSVDRNNDLLILDMKEMYEVKTRERLDPIIRDKRFSFFCRDELIINNEKCVGLPILFKALPSLANKQKLYDINSFTIIHGDLCLSNILFDRRNGIVRLIDPRGRFGSCDIYGDPRYDWAKLSHSIDGDYDFLVNGLFKLIYNENGVTLKVPTEKRHEDVKTLFRRWQKEACGEQTDNISLIESLLFLSMVPLHADRPESQKAFLARGLLSFSRLLTSDLK